MFSVCLNGFANINCKTVLGNGCSLHVVDNDKFWKELNDMVESKDTNLVAFVTFLGQNNGDIRISVDFNFFDGFTKDFLIYTI